MNDNLMAQENVSESVNLQETTKLNMWQQFIGVIIRPKATFKNLKDNPDLIFPILLMVLGTIFKSTSSMLIQKAKTAAEISKELANLPPEQAAQAQKIAQSMTSPVGIALTTFGVIFVLFLGWLIKSGILFGILKGMGGKGSFKQAVAVIGLAWLPLFFKEIFQGIYIIISGKPLVIGGSGIIGALSSTTDIFIIWNIVLLIIGFSVVFGISKTKTAVAVIGYWLVLTLFAVGSAAVGQSFVSKMQTP